MSNRLTFSLASLIVILALGLVVGIPSVMADEGTFGMSGTHDVTDGTHVNSSGVGTTEADDVESGHKHPTVTIEVVDADLNTDGTQTYTDGSGNPQLIVDVPFKLKFTFTYALQTVDTTAIPFDATDDLAIDRSVTAALVAATNAPELEKKDGSAALSFTTTIATNDIKAVGKDMKVYEVEAVLSNNASATGTPATIPAVDAVWVTLEVATDAGIGGGVYDLTKGPLYNPAGGVGSLEEKVTFALLQKAPDPAKVAVTVEGTPSVSEQFEVTFTIDKADQTLDLEKDIDVAGGELQRLGKNDNPPAGKTVYNAVFVPVLNARMVSVTIKKGSTSFKPATGMMGKIEKSIGQAAITDISPMPVPPNDKANDKADFEVYFTFDRVPPNPPMLADLSIGTMNSETDATKNDMMTGDKKNDLVTGATAPMFVSTPSRVPNQSMKWRVTVSPMEGMNTIVGLSEAGMKKFSYGTGVKALTVMKETRVTAGAVTATFVAGTDPGTGITTLAGTIGKNGFASISNFPDLEYFFEQRGTIDLDDNNAATAESEKGSRQVVISEILWGLDESSLVIGERTQWQFIELYNTTDKDIDVTGWKLVFSLARPTDDKIDVDQVSSQPPFSLGVNFLEIGESGRVTNTTAKDIKATLSPAKIISMFRKINYDQVEKVKADGTADPSRDKQLEGIPSGNDKASWAESQRPDPNTRDASGALDPEDAIWIYATRDAQHHPTPPGFLTATKIPSSPFRINEIGNDVGSDNDWVELHNVTDGAVSLENYQLTAVTAKGTDTELFDFAGNKWSVPAKGFIVIATRHPQYTDLATGKDVSLAADLQDPKGLKHLYVRKSVNLPDHGKFTLILRGGHGDAHKSEKTANHIIDVAASPEGGFSDVAIASKLWPLVGSGAPGNIKGDIKNFLPGKVYQRDKGDGRGGDNFSVASYTGIGYDVKAEVASTNYGTPGYANDALKLNMAGLTDGVIKISEIMVDVGDSPRRKLPQWIELHNSSKTLGVNLAGWKVNIENAAEPGANPETNTFYASITLGVKTILPNQTVLIVSRTGDVRNPNHFPRTRVVNLWANKAHREELEMQGSHDQVLSTIGFSIELVDKDGISVDRVGNLDGKRHTRDNIEATWKIPMLDDPSSRSSMLRVHDQKVALDGTMEKSWRLASDTVLAFEDAHVYYGNSDDVGTPGYREGGPVPVNLSKFRPERLDDGSIAIRWITESELNNAGFNILRSEKRNGEFKQINTKLIAGKGTTSERSTYTYTDPSAKPNVVYYYQIQDVSLDGKVTTLRQTRLKGHISAAGKLTTTWGELKALQ